MDGADHPRRGIRHQDRGAVRCKGPAQHAGRYCRRAVTLGTVIAKGMLRDVYPSRVHLVRDGQGVGLQAEGRRRPRLVLQDRSGIVPGPAAQVEAGIDPRGDSALAGEKGMPHSGNVKTWRGQEGRRCSAHAWAPNPGGLRPGE